MQRMAVAVLTVLICSALTSPVHADGGRHLGRYLWIGYHVLDNFTIGHVVFDREGLPVSVYNDPSVGRQENPGNIALWGLAAYNHGNRRVFLNASRWLVERQQVDGSWLYHFSWPFEGGIAPNPWRSAFTQGVAISLLLRAWQATGQVRYRWAAQRALVPFTRPINRGGVRSRPFGSTCYEEVATPHYPTCIMNGFFFGLYGLWEAWQATGSASARVLFWQGERGAAALLPYWSPAGTLLYDMAYALHPGVRENPPGGSYPAIQIGLLRLMARLTGDTRFSDLAARWDGQPAWPKTLAFWFAVAFVSIVALWYRRRMLSPKRLEDAVEAGGTANVKIAR